MAAGICNSNISDHISQICFVIPEIDYRAPYLFFSPKYKLKEKTMDKELFLLLETGDLRNIQRLDGQNPKILLGVTFQGDTPLHITTREGHRPLVDRILQ